MKRRTCLSAALTLSLVLASAAALAAPPAKRNKEPDLYRILPIQPYQLVFKTTGGATCDLATATECTIKMTTITFGRRNYCLAEAPNIRVPTDTGGAGHLKAIVWKLSAPAVDGKPVVFLAGSAIVVASDTETQLEKNDQGYGDGSGNPHTPANKYFIKTKRNKPNATLSYLPVIIWNPGPDAELCAAADPRIVNSP